MWDNSRIHYSVRFVVEESKYRKLFLVPSQVGDANVSKNLNFTYKKNVILVLLNVKQCHSGTNCLLENRCYNDVIKDLTMQIFY